MLTAMIIPFLIHAYLYQCRHIAHSNMRHKCIYSLIEFVVVSIYYIAEKNIVIFVLKEGYGLTVIS